MAIELKPSEVLFNEELHQYWLGDKQLSGITEALKKMLYPDLYSGIPASILAAAADYGQKVHHDLQKFDWEYINNGSQEVQDYIKLCKEHNLTHIASEWTVSDGKSWASNIDKIYQGSTLNSVSLGEVKTFGKLTPEKLELGRYQLSCYAWMLQLNNPGIQIDKLFIIHLRNKTTKSGAVEHISEIVYVDRVPSFVCEELLTAYLKGEKFENPYAVPAEFVSQESRIRELLATKQAVEDELAAIKANILSSMERLDAKSWQTESGMKLTRVLPQVRSSFNLPLFKKDHPEFDYSAYMKQSTVGQSLKIAV